MARQVDVAIVGGGAAGIAAARRLDGADLSVLLLEAAPRLGGRAHTVLAAGHPLDLGCGWLHSAERNGWRLLAEARGVAVDRSEAAWGRQWRDLGFPPDEQAAAWQAYERWAGALREAPPASDSTADAVAPDDPWRPFVQNMADYLSGVALERLSAADFAAYDRAATDSNWRLPAGYGALVAASLPATVERRLATPVGAVALEGRGVHLATPAGDVAARAAILTVSTAVLAGDAITLPPALDDHRHAAAGLPLGRDEKLFVALAGDHPFEPETHLIGSPRDTATASFYIRPFGWPVIECFLGGAAAERLVADGEAACFAHAADQLAALVGGGVRRQLRPLVSTRWSADPLIGGAYSAALPGHSASRAALARAHDGRLFLAGEATSPRDFSTAHGAHDSGVRAAEEVLEALSPLGRGTYARPMRSTS